MSLRSRSHQSAQPAGCHRGHRVGEQGAQILRLLAVGQGRHPSRTLLGAVSLETTGSRGGCGGGRGSASCSLTSRIDRLVELGMIPVRLVEPRVGPYVDGPACVVGVAARESLWIAAADGGRPGTKMVVRATGDEESVTYRGVGAARRAFLEHIERPCPATTPPGEPLRKMFPYTCVLPAGFPSCEQSIKGGACA